VAVAALAGRALAGAAPAGPGPAGPGPAGPEPAGPGLAGPGLAGGTPAGPGLAGRALAARPAVPALAAAALVLAPLALPAGGWTAPSGPPLSVRLVQGNVAQDMKFVPERTVAAMADYATRFEAGAAQLTVLPETAWTLPWDRTPEEIARRVLAHAARGHAIAIGMPLWTDAVPASGAGAATAPGAGEAEPRIANSVLMITPALAAGTGAGPVPRYDKRHLVPFGEFVPWGFGWFVDMMRIPLGDFARGADGQPPFEVGGQRIAFNVCYEDLFGEELIGSLHGERGATVLANVSNIAWFGRSHALPQHLAIARMRSLETGRPMLRATNTGTTAAIDGDGRVLAALAPHEAGSLDVVVQGTTGLTPYARLGNGPALGAALALLAAAAVAARRGGAGRTR
ncbi:MAG TPA: apolipoprotein N-acyltransferase, partial [Burkholderiaceae bacterium]|nr:apolipoprotein N-acyltransferase [Burkholderiaceae bacterium]